MSALICSTMLAMATNLAAPKLLPEDKIMAKSYFWVAFIKTFGTELSILFRNIYK